MSGDNQVKIQRTGHARPRFRNEGKTGKNGNAHLHVSFENIVKRVPRPWNKKQKGNAQDETKDRIYDTGEKKKTARDSIPLPADDTYTGRELGLPGKVKMKLGRKKNTWAKSY